MAKYVVKLTLEDALKLGIVHCECGHPPNNHFEHWPRTCAHCHCKKLKPHFSRGKAIK